MNFLQQKIRYKFQDEVYDLKQTIGGKVFSFNEGHVVVVWTFPAAP